MNKIITLTLIIGSFIATAQSEDALKKIESAKIALITERLDLTPEQAEKFWPIYREYGAKRKEIRKEFQTIRKDFDPNSASEEENKKMLELGNSVRENQLNLEKEYSQRILKVISSRQLNNLRRAESDFKEMLLKRIKNRQQQRRQQQMNDNRLQNRRN